MGGTGERGVAAAAIGIALYPEHGPIADLIANAEAAMRSAKSSGGAGYPFFEQRMTSGARDQFDLLRDLRRRPRRRPAAPRSSAEDPRAERRDHRRRGAGSITSAAWSGPSSSSRSPSALA
jgi:hypothetical protein